MKKFFFNLTIVALIGWTLLFGALSLGSCASMVQHVDTTNEYAAAGAGLGLILGGGFLTFIWLAGVIAMGIFALILKPSKADKIAEEIKQLRLQTASKNILQ